MIKGINMKNIFKRVLTLTVTLAIIICLIPAVSAEDDLHLLYGRRSLSFMAKGELFAEAYDRIVEGVENRSDEIDLSDLELDGTELDWIVTAYRNDPHGHFWVLDSYNYMVYTNGQVASYVPHYNSLGLSGDEEFAQYKKNFNNACNTIIRKAGISSSSNDYTKAKNLHDALIKHITYTFSDNAHNEYGALVEGACVCQGYTLSYQYLLRLMGVEAYSVVGIANGEGHSWNLVKIDGDYYLTDVTWDDSDNGSGNDSEIYYSYFNVTTATLSNDHYWTVPVYSLPLCTSTEANYYTLNPDITFTSSSTPADIAALIEDGFGRIYLPTGTPSAFSNWFYDNGYEILTNCGYDLSQDLTITYSSRSQELHIFIDGILNDPFANIMKGDVNDDGNLSAIDSNLIKRIIAGMQTATEKQSVAGDIDGDEKITGIDSNLLRRIVAGT